MNPLKQFLTKHLYRVDEVLSSLRWSIITHTLTDTAFWTIELYESNLIQECIDLLENIWIHHVGFDSWFLLKCIQGVYETGEISQSNLVKLSCVMARRKTHDSTTFHLLLRGATSPSWKPIFPHSKEYQNLEEAVTDCIKRGKLKEAWLLSRSMEPSEQWILLESIAAIRGRKEAIETIKTLGTSIYAQLAIAYILVSLDDTAWIRSQEEIEHILPVEVIQAIDDWSKETSMRKRRAIKPKPEALLHLTLRSQQSPYISSESDIQENLLKSLEASEYWSTILSSYMLKGNWISDIRKESFFETFFPQDIPDEWSLKDREQSHGRGLGKSIEQGRSRFIYYTILRSKSLKLWNSVFPELDCSMEWDSIYDELKKKSKIEFPMTPIKKIFEIIS